MKLTYNWIKEFVDISLPADELADKLTMAGIEVKSVDAIDGDYVFEIEITSNRPDWLSVVGIAREVAAVTGTKLTKKPVVKKQATAGGNAGSRKIGIESGQDCPLYTARIFSGVKVGQSPEWMRRRLEMVGCRSVNNVVDITNYVLFELGAPLHAFDIDALSPESIRVRRGVDGEKLVTIDGQERLLNGGVLVIADDNKPVAVAGVMGGKDTEVGFSTKNVLLEAAVFQPVVVRRGRQCLGLQTEASYRFERGIDPEIVQIASSRAAELICELAGGAEESFSIGGNIVREDRKVTIALDAVNTVLGINIDESGARQILESLEIPVSGNDSGSITVMVPSHRPDIRSQIDLVEEIARIYGFDRTPVSLSPVKPQIPFDPTYGNISLLKTILTGLGLDEVITYSMTDIKSLNGSWEDEKDLVLIQSPLSEDQGVLRPVLTPSVAKCAAYNIRQQNDFVPVFEIAKTFQKRGATLAEEYHLCAVLCGTKPVWIEADKKRWTDTPGFLHLKGIACAIFDRLGIRGYEFSSQDNETVFLLLGGEKAGILSKLSKDALSRLGVKNREIFAVEMNLRTVWGMMNGGRKYEPISRFPGVSRDISVVVEDGVSTAEILEQIKKNGGDFLQSAEISDFYKGSQIPPGHKNLTISCFYRSNSRTLQEDEISSAHDAVVELLKKSFGASIR